MEITVENFNRAIADQNAEIKRVGFITENEFDVNTDETVMVEIFQANEEDFFVRVYETDEVEQCEDLPVAQHRATDLAYEYLVS